jgi:hypothetical protein
VAALSVAAGTSAVSATPHVSRAVPPRAPRAPYAKPAAARSLDDVSVLSDDDAWAVGDRTASGSKVLTWVRHWDGSRWSAVASPSPGTSQNSLDSVVAISSSDVWAVGTQRDTGQGEAGPLVEHWDGVSWSVASTPNVSGIPYDVSASGADDVWVVGDRFQDPIADHWDGTSWTETALAVPDVTPPYQVTLMIPYAVTAISPDDAWAIGIYDAQDGQGGYQRGILAEHWDGTAWSVVPAPHQANWSYPFDISATGPDDVWAVGLTDVGHSLPFTAHWDGTAWTTTTQAFDDGDDRALTGVTAIAPNDVWAVGYHRTHTQSGYHTGEFVEHWDGTQWSVDDGANLKPDASLGGVDALGPNDVFAVGGFSRHRQGRALAQHWDGAAWTLWR